LLREGGHDVVGVFMRHGQEGESNVDATTCNRQGCCSAADAADARRVAQMLDIPFYAVNFEKEFQTIIDHFVSEYTAGRTPNPCIQCNTLIKFGRLFEYADSIGAKYVATGHYARLVETEGEETALCRGLDDAKDQSYVLFVIRREFLPRLMFPVGEYRKPEIRRIAERLGLRVADKRDSQEICFVPERNHAAFVRSKRGDIDTSGDIVDTKGQVLGHHDGFERFTVGQRKGIGIAMGEPCYVVRIEAQTRWVVIGPKEELAVSRLTANETNWLTDPGGAISCEVKIRYRSPAVEGTVQILPGNRFEAELCRPCWGVAPGQAAVCYRGDRVLGGGWIE